MIVEFTIRNYRSIKDEQTFSFYAGDYKTEAQAKEKSELPNNITFMPKGNGNSGVTLLNVAAIYGANASGKSNILMAFKTLRQIILNSEDLKADSKFVFYDPYVLCKEAASKPTFFRLKFFCNIDDYDKPILCDYKIEFDSQYVLEESLSFYPNGSPAELFSKQIDQTWETMKIGNYVKGKKRRISFHRNASYLSAIGNDAAAPFVLKNIYYYLVDSIRHVSVDGNIKVRRLSQKKRLIDSTVKALSLFDTGISGLKLSKRNLSEFLADNKELVEQLKNIPEPLVNEIIEDRLLTKAQFLHKGKKHSAYIPEKEISNGTRKMFDFIPVLFYAFQNGNALIIDELEAKFHPHIAKLIIKLFNDERVNRKGAQLIFSTHSTELMDNDLLRRDQIWFTEKDQGETVLFSLADFDSGKVRCHSPFAKWYLDGRFGAIPQFNYLEIADLFVELEQVDEDSIND